MGGCVEMNKLDLSEIMSIKEELGVVRCELAALKKPGPPSKKPRPEKIVCSQQPSGQPPILLENLRKELAELLNTAKAMREEEAKKLETPPQGDSRRKPTNQTKYHTPM
jgi:hypothetical protein